jgi:CRISPR-associated protein Cmr5
MDYVSLKSNKPNNMKQRINKYIPLALDAIRSQIANGGTEVDERYDGYAASLGPAIITSGLKPAIAFYTDMHRGSGGTRRLHILQVIASILISDGEPIKKPADENGLLEYVKDMSATAESALGPKIMDAIVAVKLAFRNFKQVKKAEE